MAENKKWLKEKKGNEIGVKVKKKKGAIIYKHSKK